MSSTRAAAFLSRLSASNYVLLIALLYILTLLEAPLRGSLWLDESITCWIIKGGLATAFSRAFEYQGQSPFYFLLAWIFKFLTGMSELGLRLPSVLCLLCSALLLFKCTKLLYDAETGAIAAALFICCDEVLRASISIRPYAFALLLSLLSVWLLLRWLEERRTVDLMFYGCALTLLFYAHYLFILAMVFHVALLITKKERALLLPFSGVCTAALLLSLPGLYHLQIVSSRADLYRYTLAPDLVALLNSILPPFLVVLIITAVLAGVVVLPSTWKGTAYTNSRTAALLVGWLGAPLIFYTLSHISDRTLFMPRFFLWQSPITVMLGAILIRSFDRRETRGAIMVLICALAITVPRVWMVEDWRASAHIIAAEYGKKGGVPLLIYPGLVEADTPAWITDPAHRDYALAPYAYYSTAPVHDALILPGGFKSAAAQQYFNASILPALEKAAELLLISPHVRQMGVESSGLNLPELYLEKFEAFGFKRKEVLLDGAVVVLNLFKENSANIDTHP